MRGVQRLCVTAHEAPDQLLRMLKVDGTANPADAFTKHLTKPAFKPYAAKIYNEMHYLQLFTPYSGAQRS